MPLLRINNKTAKALEMQKKISGISKTKIVEFATFNFIKPENVDKKQKR